MSLTLREAKMKMTRNGTFAAKVPFIVWLLENPKSPLRMPGSISLAQHDYVHCLLKANMRLPGEAFVIGFTMGCDSRVNAFHLWLFKVISCNLYPRQYRFRGRRHWVVFKRGYDLARKTHIRDLETFDFESWLDRPVEQLRQLFFGKEVLGAVV